MRWDQEAVDKLTHNLLDHLQHLSDDDLGLMVGEFYDGSWVENLDSDEYCEFLEAMMILGLGSYAAARERLGG